jgi:hypothetical protein
VHVTLHLQAPTLPVVPSTALVWRNEQTMLAVVRGARVRFVPVKTGLDDGKTVQIVSGVRAGELVALDLPTEIGEGALVRPALSPAAAAPAAQAGGAGAPARRARGQPRRRRGAGARRGPRTARPPPRR